LIVLLERAVFVSLIEADSDIDDVFIVGACEVVTVPEGDIEGVPENDGDTDNVDETDAVTHSGLNGILIDIE